MPKQVKSIDKVREAEVSEYIEGKNWKSWLLEEPLSRITIQFLFIDFRGVFTEPLHWPWAELAPLKPPVLNTFAWEV